MNDTNMEMHYEISTKDVSVTQEWKKHLSYASHKSGVIDQGK